MSKVGKRIIKGVQEAIIATPYIKQIIELKKQIEELQKENAELREALLKRNIQEIRSRARDILNNDTK